MTEQFGGLAQTPDDVAGLVEVMARVSEGFDDRPLDQIVSSASLDLAQVAAAR